MESIYEKDKTNIIHYPGLEKPWFYPEMQHADIWWEYARRTPFYEEILKRMAMSAIPMPPPPGNTRQISDYAKYWKYKILQNFGSKETRTRYYHKKRIYKAKIKGRR